jgi:hypothetical protein
VLAETRHCVDFEFAGRAGVGVARLGFRLIHVREDLLAALQVALAGLGQRDAARRAVQQARAQVRLQIGHRARRIRGGRVQMLRGARKAARFDDADKYAHVLKRIHNFPL